MKPQVHRTPAAIADVTGIADYLAATSSETALQFIDDTEAAFNRLLQQPELGARHAFADQRLVNIRIWSPRRFKNYLIFYRPTADGILVIRVLHSARDWEEIVRTGP